MQAVCHAVNVVFKQLIGTSLRLGGWQSDVSSVFQDWDLPFQFRDEKRFSGVKWTVVERIVRAWLLTLPATGLIGYVLARLAHQM